MRRLAQGVAWVAALSVTGVAVVTHEAMFALGVVTCAAERGLLMLAVSLADYSVRSR